MKILNSVMVALLVLLTSGYAASADSGWMRISLLAGDVQIKTTDSGDWGPASLNGPVMEGDQIWVPEGGRVELQLNAGTFIRLDQNSSLQILATDKDSSQFYLSQGHAYVYYDGPGRGVIQVDTPDASTRAFDAAVFRIDISDEYQLTDVSVYKGSVETENQLGRTEVRAGEMVSLGQDTDGEVAPMGEPDEWEMWNKERNDRIAERGASSRYLPPELRTYSYDLDANGRWVDIPDYGYCWTPTVIGGVNWAPYSKGRWIWRGGEYIWVSYDPWGWAPYHYGRWTFVARTGWCWVPPAAGDAYWGPGYVGWVATGDYVAWVPLAPGEIYYGRGYYGRHSVNIATVNINQIHITNIYRNVYVNNGATVVNRRTFATASPKHVRINRNVIERQIFTKNNIRPGMPSIRPTKQSYFASSRSIPAAKRPPQHVRDIQITHLKQSRPLVKAQDRSVIKPGTRLNPLPLQTIRTPRMPGRSKPSIRQIIPEGQGRPATPRRGPAPREERRDVKPEVRPIVPQRTPTPKEQRRDVKPEVRPVVPQRTPTPREERRDVKPVNKPAPERPADAEKKKKAAEEEKEKEKKQKDEERER